MAVEFNHTIVHARNKSESADFYAEILGLKKPETFGIFLVVRLNNKVSLDFVETAEKIEPQHYAFHVSEEDFDEIFARIKSRKLIYWADPRKHQSGATYKYEGGRGVYFEDPSGNFLEILTWNYGR